MIRAIRAQDRDLSALRTKVRRSSASSSAGAQARRAVRLATRGDALYRRGVLLLARS